MHPFQRLILCSPLVLCSLLAHAQPTIDYFDMATGRTGTAINYGGGQIHVWPDAGDRRQISNGSNGSVVVRDRVPVNTSRGAITVTARSSVNARAIARGAAIAGRALPAAGIAIGVGSLIWDLLDDNYIKPDGSGGLNLDPGVPPAEGDHFCWYSADPNPALCNTSVAAAGAATVAYIQKGMNPQSPCSVSLGGVTLAFPYGYYDVVMSCPLSSTTTTYATSASPKNGKYCLPVDGKTVMPRGDGRCPSALRNPLTDDQVIDIVARDITDKKDKVPLVNDILGTPGGAIDITPDSTVTSGPSAQTGTPPAPVVTTGPGGSVTTTESPGIAIRYRGREVEWEPQQITTRRPSPIPGQPDQETITDAPDEPSADPQSGVTPDYCLSNPKRAACSELGQVDPPEWNPDEKPIELKAESPWGSDNGSCPPPRTLVIGGKQYQWEWTLVCDFFSGVRFAVIASAWIAAVIIFIGARSDT